MNQFEIREALLEIEDDLGVFDICPDGVPIWERLRLNVFHELNRELTDTRIHTRTDFETSSYLKGIQLWARNAVSKNPFFGGQRLY